MQGAQSLANALRCNTVRQVCSYLSYVRDYDLKQALTALDLGWNKVSDEGAQYLENSLQNNTVRQLFCSHQLHTYQYTT